MPSTAAELWGKGKGKEKESNSNGAILRIRRRLKQLICPQISMIVRSHVGHSIW